LLGVPQGDLPRFRRWSDEIVEGFVTMASPVWPPWLRKRARIAIAIRRLERYLQPLIAARRAAPTDDLLGRLLASSDDGRLSSEELFWFVLLLLVAGNETTTNLLSVLALALAEYPDQYELLRRGPDRIAAAVEEALRYSSSIQGFFRVAHSDYRVGDVTIPAGASVLLHFGAANRDPRRYAAPDDFAIDRDVSDQLAFGSGIHFCLGAHLARLEAAIVLEALIERVERVELAGEPVWLSNPTLRGLSRLPLRLLPA
jgi:cytochrome P450